MAGIADHVQGLDRIFFERLPHARISSLQGPKSVGAGPFEQPPGTPAKRVGAFEVFRGRAVGLLLHVPVGIERKAATAGQQQALVLR